MFHSLFTQAGVCFSGATARRFVARAASLAALTALMLGTLSGTAMAQVVRDHRTGSGETGTAPPTANTNTKPLRVSFAGLHCLQESNDDSWPFPDHDEPYLVVFAADLRGGTANGIVLLSQTFSDMDKGDVVEASAKQ